MLPGKRIVRLLFLLVVMALGGFAAAQGNTHADGNTPAEGSGPHLFLDSGDFARIKAMAAAEPWAAKERQKVLDAAAAFPVSYEKHFGLTSVELPPVGGQWGHYYACPESGRQLVFTPPNHNTCPDTGKEYPGYPFDEVVYTQRADTLGADALNLALAYRLGGERKFAVESAGLLKAYADKYLTYAIHDNHGGTAVSGARVYSQTLDEAIWLIEMAWAYDLLQGTDVMTAAERMHVENDLLRPAVAVVSRAGGLTYNWQSWINASIAAVGYTLGDKKLVTQALDGPFGFRYQMKTFVVDGFWTEGTWGYQFYALNALVQTAAMAQRNGTDLWREEPNLKALLDAPFGMMFPDGTLPPFNDSRVESIYDQAPLYEYPYAATRDPLFAEVITHGPHLRTEGEGLPFGQFVAAGERSNRNALLFGVPEIAHEKLPELKSVVYPEAGYAVLRADGGALTEVMKFGPHGSGHGHFDKLGEVIYARGGLMSVDPGTQFYGVASHETWDKSTVAHNTVVVDGKSQEKATGQLLDWEVGAGFTTVKADAGPAYAGVAMTRRVVMTPRYILEITDVKATDGKEHTFDWVYHNFGEQKLQLPMMEWNGFKATDGYQHLTGNRISPTPADWQDVFRDGDRGMHLLMLHDADNTTTSVISGMGLGPDLKVPVPYVMARRTGTAAEYVALMEPFGAAPVVSRFTRNANGSISIEGPDWLDVIQPGEKVGVLHLRLNGVFLSSH